MRIDTGLKLRPFSHRPGTICLIPFTTWQVQVFPAKLFFQNLANFEKEEITLPIVGPVKGFTVMCNLEKGRVEVFGTGAKGYFRYFLTDEGLLFAKGPRISLPFIEPARAATSELRTSFGVHKKQDWEGIQRRADLAEIFPFWIRLAELIPKISLSKGSMGTAVLLEEGRFDLFFQAGFEGMLSPRFNDEKYLGIIPNEHIEMPSLGLLHEGASRILRLFFQDQGEKIHLLAQLPKELHSGRITHLLTTQRDRIDIEWSKKSLKKVIIRPQSSRSIQLVLQKKLRSFRLRQSLRGKGEVYSRNQLIELNEGKTVYLDRFSH